MGLGLGTYLGLGLRTARGGTAGYQLRYLGLGLGSWAWA